MSSSTCRLIALASLVGVVLLGGGRDEAAGADSDPVRAFFAALKIGSADLGQVHRGEPLARTLPVRDSREVAVLGLARAKITPEFFVSRLADIAHFKRGDAVAQIGVFGNPAREQELSALRLDEADVRSLKGCRVGDCGVQLSAAAIERFRREVDWRRADAAAQADRLMRQILAEYVDAYQRSGAAAAMEYADRKDRVNLAGEFASLTEASGPEWREFPALRQHLSGYPGSPAPGATDVLYWSKEKMGRRAVLSVTHLAILKLPADAPVAYLAASKHLYGTHYLDASLGLTILLRDNQATGPSTYILYVNRSRVDVFGGVFGGLARRIVTSRARSTVADQLAGLQQRLEREFTGSSPD